MITLRKARPSKSIIILLSLISTLLVTYYILPVSINVTRDGVMYLEQLALFESSREVFRLFYIAPLSVGKFFTDDLATSLSISSLMQQYLLIASAFLFFYRNTAMFLITVIAIITSSHHIALASMIVPDMLVATTFLLYIGAYKVLVDPAYNHSKNARYLLYTIMTTSATWGLLLKINITFAIAACMLVSTLLYITKEKKHRLHNMLAISVIAVLLKFIASSTIDTVVQPGNQRHTTRILEYISNIDSIESLFSPFLYIEKMESYFNLPISLLIIISLFTCIFANKRLRLFWIGSIITFIPFVYVLGIADLRPNQGVALYYFTLFFSFSGFYYLYLYASTSLALNEKWSINSRTIFRKATLAIPLIPLIITYSSDNNFGNYISEKTKNPSSLSDVRFSGILGQNLDLLEELNRIGAKNVFYDYTNNMLENTQISYTEMDIRFYPGTTHKVVKEKVIHKSWSEFIKSERGIAHHKWEHLTPRRTSVDKLLTYRTATPTYKYFILNIEDLCGATEKHDSYLILRKSRSRFFYDTLRKKFGWKEHVLFDKRTALFRLSDMPASVCTDKYHVVSPILKELIRSSR